MSENGDIFKIFKEYVASKLNFIPVISRPLCSVFSGDNFGCKHNLHLENGAKYNFNE